MQLHKSQEEKIRLEEALNSSLHSSHKHLHMDHSMNTLSTIVDHPDLTSFEFDSKALSCPYSTDDEIQKALKNLSDIIREKESVFRHVYLELSQKKWHHPTLSCELKESITSWSPIKNPTRKVSLADHHTNWELLLISCML
jgi:hypothetical protein